MDDNNQHPLSRLVSAQYLPSTFEDRGVAVPFTTPVLSCARARPDERHALVLLTPGFAGTSSVYVLPWAAIPGMVSMTAHDRTLHEAIEAAKALDPASMRREALKVAAIGLAGPDAQVSAIRSIGEDQAYAEQIHAVLILFLLAGIGIDVSRITRLDLSRAETLSEARTALKLATEPLGVDLDLLYARMGKLSETLRFLGLSSFGKPGRLRLQLRDLVEFGQSMMTRSRNSKGDVAEFFTFAAEVASHTAALAKNILSALDRSLESPQTVLRGWELQFPRLERRAVRLSWLLDGWDYPVAFARDSDLWSGEDLWLNLDTLARMLPLVPRAEKEDGAEAENSRFKSMMQRRRVTALQDWRTGAVDTELVRRLELAKSRSLITYKTA